jgi:hypothetical protein
LTIDLNEYSEDAIVKLPLKKKFIEDFVKLANMPIIGIEEINSDVVIKVNTGRKITPQPTQTGGGIDF